MKFQILAKGYVVIQRRAAETTDEIAEISEKIRNVSWWITDTQVITDT